MTTAIHQPNFLPWVGYFHKISQVDKFVLFDDVQFERGKTFTSRTKILIQGKETWLTIPVKKKSYLTNIKDIETDSSFIWKKKHLKTITINYGKLPFFDEVFDIITSVYSSNSKYLIDYNIPLITKISKYLNFKVDFIKSSQIERFSINNGLDRIMDILLTTRSDEYLSGLGSGSMRYLDENIFLKNNIKLKWQQFDYKPYPQLTSNIFISGLSILDLLFNCGQESINYL